MIRFLIFIIILPACLVSWAQTPEQEWKVFRGKSDLSGSIEYNIPASPVLLWSMAAGSHSKSSPVVSNGVIYFGDDKGILYAVGEDGKLMWKYDSRSPIEAPPMVSDDKVIAGTSDGKLFAVNKLTGKFLWTYSSDNQIVGSANVWTAGKNSGIIFGSYDYYLHCVDPVTGKAIWKLETENYVNGTPAVADNKIVFGGCDGILRITDPMTGKERDTINIGVYIAASPALFRQKAYFGDYNGNFYCVDLAGRKVAWKITAGETTGSIL